MQDFSLLGGPLHRWICQSGLARGKTNTTWFGLTLGVALWLVLLAIAGVNGVAGELFSLARVSGHVRLLVVIPLLFYAEWILDPKFAAFIGLLPRSGVVPAGERPAFDAAIASIVRWKDSWFGDALSLLLALAVSASARHLPIVGVTAGAEQSSSQVLWVCWLVSLTLFRFLLMRWVVRLALWAVLLWRISRLTLHLVPTHPDRAAGLGYLEVVHTHFAPLVLALSAVQAASLAEELYTGVTPFSGIAGAIAFALIADAVLFVGPMLFFSGKLWRCRGDGLRFYSEFASEYVSGFERKWLGPRPPNESLLGTPDLQSLADLGNSVTIIRAQRLLVASPYLWTTLGAAAVAPMLPLLLFRYPMAELVEKFLRRLSGF